MFNLFSMVNSLSGRASYDDYCSQSHLKNESMFTLLGNVAKRRAIILSVLTF